VAIQSNPKIQITNGTTTVTFADGAGGLTNYPLVRRSWAPAVAGIRNNVLGGRYYYGDVIEELTFNIRDTTGALCWSRLDTLARLLDKAERWWLKNENISPVILKYAPQGSTIHSNATPMQAIVLGRVGSDELNGVDLPADANDAGMIFEIRGIKIACLRRGAWSGASESASAGAAANPAVLSVTMPSSPTIPGSLKVEITGFTTFAATGNIDIPSGYVFVGPNNSMDRQQAEAGTAPGASTGANPPTISTVADAAARASGGSVLRFTSTAAGAMSQVLINWTLPAAFATATRIAVFCTYRNNGANAWIIDAGGGVSAGGTPIYDRTPRTPTITIPAAASTYPQVLSLGEISNVYGFDTVQLGVGTVLSVAGATFDIDTIVTLDMSSGETYVVAVAGVNTLALGASYASKNTEIAINNDPLTLRAPQVTAPILTTSLILPISYSGDTALVGRGGTLQVMWYATHYWNLTTPYWTTQNIGGSAILNIGATITRRLSYVSPQ
jgi:hypothetical protein